MINTTRKTTNLLLDLIEEGVLDPTEVVVACLKYMSEAEVKDMAEYNGMLPLPEEEEQAVTKAAQKMWS